jgi:hypothetical protein
MPRRRPSWSFCPRIRSTPKPSACLTGVWALGSGDPHFLDGTSGSRPDAHAMLTGLSRDLLAFLRVARWALAGEPIDCTKLCRISISILTRKLLKRLAPQAGFEPATLRLTGGKNEISRALPSFAGICRTLRQPAKNLAIFRFRPLPRFAGLCRPLLQPKGKKRARLRITIFDAARDV